MKSARPNWKVLCLLYFLALVLNLVLVRAANHQGVLTWEESSWDFREVFLVPGRVLYYAELGADAFLLAVSKLFSPLPLFYARWVTACAMALLSPLCYWIALRLGISRRSSVLVAALLPLFPGIFSFSWMGAAFGTETILGMVALLLATYPGFWAGVLAAAIAATAMHVYGTGIIFLPPVLAMLFWKRRFGSFALQALVALAVAAFPFFWVKASTFRMVTGGGAGSSVHQILANLGLLLRELFYRTSTYYCFPHYAALSNPIVGSLAVIGLVITLSQRRWNWAWVWFTFALAVGAYTGGQMTGIRRGVPIVFFSAIFLGMALDVISESVRTRSSWLRQAAPVLVAVFFVYSFTQYGKTARRLWDGTIDLPRDFRFAVQPPLANMESTLEWLVGNPAVADNPAAYDPSIVLPEVYLVSESKGVPVYSREFVLSRIKKSIELRTGEPHL